MERRERLLYDASVEGNITILLMLVQEDPLILDRLTLNRCDDMPLHVAAMLGHIDFVREILIRKPHLAMERDSQRRLPLHIAAAKGHLEIVKALVSANSETCLVDDRDGRNPLHLAAIKGRCDVVKEVVRTQPHAARAIVQQETILHLCVKHNQLEVLKFLIDTIGNHEFVNTKDADGNTILHLAVADKQIETINFLLLNTTIEVNASNTNGETPMDILVQGPRDVKDQQIIRSLIQAGVIEPKNESLFGQIPQDSKYKKPIDNLKYSKKPNMSHHLKKDLINKEDWLDKKRNTLMVVASLIATMAFQAGTNPPGGVWQEDSTADPPAYRAGNSVMETNHPNFYHVFLVCDTLGFVSSLSIILLLISGLPILKHPVFLRIQMVIMWIATASMSLTYYFSVLALTSKSDSKTIIIVASVLMIVWIVVMTLLVVGYTIWINEIGRLRQLPFSRNKTFSSPTNIYHAQT